jgi:DNA-binding response OmpR family regulator
MKVCSALKSDKRYSAVPVVILTTMAGEMLKIVEGGKPDHFVVKSGEPDELMEVLEALLSGRKH